MDRDNTFEMRGMKRTFVKPKTEIVSPQNKAEAYLKSRGFSKETWERRKVSSDEKGNIVFPYYENDELVMLKFRIPQKYNGKGQKAWREEGGKPILWGMDLCNPTLPLVITEGEYDTLALDEAGIENVVSVPSGSSDLTWVELCWDWLERFNKIILWGDNDEPGKIS